MNTALILSGGTGTRLGADIPKQYLMAGGKPLIAYCIETLSMHDMIDTIWIVADAAWQERLIQWLHKADRNKKFRGFSKPGANRQLSVFHGLEDIRKSASDDDIVLIHDAARPLLTHQMITDCIEGMRGHEGVLPVLPMKDTIYQSEDGRFVSSLLDRKKLFAGQAPECFVLGRYLEANRKLLPDKILAVNGSTEPAVLAGMDIVMIKGDERNFKITTQADLDRFCRWLNEKD
ncbi:MAG: 2-C-methyl-D-erythritol 4-phosphate cytidylyltransferase [Lachnospiraceae bacterium]|nr:2-C-methyl-D-erythritol 4-phosphate cytidylyltransferase [Lachnospiraceae bacterium]